MNDQDLVRVEASEDPEVCFDLGVKLGEKGDFIGAIEAFKKGLKLNPEEVMAWINLGLVYGRNGDFQEEIKAYKKALLLDPENMEVWAFRYSLANTLKEELGQENIYYIDDILSKIEMKRFE